MAHYEYGRVKTMDGSTETIDDPLDPLDSSGSELEGWDTLREAREFLELVEGLGATVIVDDTHHGVIGVNAIGRQLLGYSSEELEGMKTTDLSGLTAEQHHSRRLERRRDGELTSPWQATTSDGSVMRAAIALSDQIVPGAGVTIAVPLDDPGEPLLDVAWLRNTLHHAVTGVDPDGVLDSCLAEAHRRLGEGGLVACWRRDRGADGALLESGIGWKDPGLRIRPESCDSRIVFEPGRLAEMRIDRDGVLAHHGLASAVTARIGGLGRSGDGSLAYYCPDRRVFDESEERWMRIFADLISISRLQARRRRKAGSEVSEAEAELASLAAGIAHEFNNSLSVILGFGRLIAEDLAATESIVEAANEIEIAAKRAGAVSRSLSDLTRYRLAPPCLIPASEVLTEFARGLEPIMPHGVRLTTDIESGLPAVALPAGSLERVVVNLVLNARHAVTEAGGGSILVSARHAGGPGIGRVVITVRDTGVGMSPEVLAQAMRPRFSTRSASGAGLGLSLARRIVEGAGGNAS